MVPPRHLVPRRDTSLEMEPAELEDFGWKEVLYIPVIENENAATLRSQRSTRLSSKVLRFKNGLFNLWRDKCKNMVICKSIVYKQEQ